MLVEREGERECGRDLAVDEIDLTDRNHCPVIYMYNNNILTYSISSFIGMYIYLNYTRRIKKIKKISSKEKFAHDITLYTILAYCVSNSLRHIKHYYVL